MRIILILLSLLLVTSCEIQNNEMLIDEANKLAEDGEYLRAIKLLDKVLDKDPNDQFSLFDRAFNKSLLSLRDEAFADYTELLKQDSSNTLAYYNRGILKSEMQDFKEAILDFERAIKTKGGERFFITYDPKVFPKKAAFNVEMEEILFERAYAFYNIDSLEKAYGDIDYCIRKNYNLGDSYYLRGLIHKCYSMEEEANSDFLKSIENGSNISIDSINNIFPN